MNAQCWYMQGEVTEKGMRVWRCEVRMLCAKLAQHLACSAQTMFCGLLEMNFC